MHKCEVVIIRDFMGRAKATVVCNASETKVFVTSESAYERMQNGETSVMPIGFDRADVFEYDPEYLKSPNWAKMRHWRG